MRLARVALVTIVTFSLFLIPHLANAQTAKNAPRSAAAPFALTIPNIMRGPELVGYEPSSITWSLNGETLFFQWKEASESRTKRPAWYAVDVRASVKTPRKLSDDEADRSVPPNGADRTQNGKRIVFSDDNDLWLMDADKPGQRTKLTDTGTIAEFSPHWTRDEKHVTYTSDGNLFKMAIEASEPLTQLTDIRRGSPPAGDPPKYEGVAKIARDGERELFGVIRDQVQAREAGEAERKAREAKQVRKPFYLPSGTNAGSALLSPDETQVLLFIYEPAKNAPGDKGQSVVPQWVTESGYVEAPQGRPNVGGATGHARCVLLDTQTGAQTPVTPPDALSPRGLFFKDAAWSEGKDNNAPIRLAVLAEASDFHDHYLFTVDRKTGQAAVVHDEHDSAWVDGPGADQWGWMPDSAHLWVCTEQSGFSHLALVDVDKPDAPPAPLTSGRFEVFNPRISRDKSAFYFTSSESDLGERRLYKMPLTGGARTPVVALPGINEEMTLSPDETCVAFVNSYTNRPPEAFVQTVAANAKAERLTVSPSSAFRGFPWRDVPVVTFPARDGFPIHARLFTPTGPKRKRAAVLFIHGAGYLQNANKGWSYYSREYMFSHFLAERGYTVLDVDYRGSAGYGRDSRTAIYKQMGGKDLDDVTDAARWLVKTQNVDPARIGCWGGSYGGFLTLMALFKESGTFACGAALRPVTDWTKYNHGYTAPILGLPQDDIAAYKRSSPIYFASGLRGGLLICHGMLDDNVFFQDSVRLTQKLIELGKDDWEIAPYPIEEHGFTEASSWTDEYKRIYRLFETHLQKP